MKTKKLFYAFSALVLSFLLIACNGSDKSKVGIAFSAKNTKAIATPSKGPMRAPSAISADIESFQINIAEIEFEFDDDDPLFNENDPFYDDDLELKGPFIIDLMRDHKEQVQVILKDVDLPYAAYEEIEFEFDKVEKKGHPMRGYSILVEGKIGDKDFKYFTDEEFEMEVELPKGFKVKEGVDNMINVQFDIAKLFDPTLGGVDLSKAVDSNGDGVIIITNMDTKDADKNKSIAEQIKNRLKDIIDSIEDAHDFDDDDDDDDDDK